MTYYSTFQKRGLKMAILGVVCAIFLSFGYFQPVLGSNNYISAIKLYSDKNGLVWLDFYVNTTFEINIGAEQGWYGNTSFCAVAGNYYFGVSYPYQGSQDVPFFVLVPDNDDLVFTCNKTFTYEAGHLYKNVFIRSSVINKQTKKLCLLNNCPDYGDLGWTGQSGEPTEASYISNLGKSYNINSGWPMSDTEKYYYTEIPTISISWPLNNAEIVSAFDIAGSYTIPSSEAGNDVKLFAIFGDYQRVDDFGYPLPIYSFSTSTPNTSGDFSIHISGVSAGDYILYFYIAKGENIISSPFENPLTIHIVNSIAPELPTGEIPPVLPAFTYQDFENYYASNSEYATPTPQFLAMCGAISPLISNLGNNLTNFANNFTQASAVENASPTASAILTARQYANNLNSILGNWPISEMIGVFFITFLAVAVFRLAKNIISLFKL